MNVNVAKPQYNKLLSEPPQHNCMTQCKIHAHPNSPQETLLGVPIGGWSVEPQPGAVQVPTERCRQIGLTSVRDLPNRMTSSKNAPFVASLLLVVRPGVEASLLLE